MPLKQVDLDVEPAGAGRTLAATLREIAGVSHSMAHGLVEQGLVRVNGRVVRRPARRLESGDRIEARFDPAIRYRQRARPAGGSGFRVLMEDDDLVVVNKDPGLLTVPAPSHPGGSLADLLLKMYASRGFRSPRLWIVHRIDRYTSGLVLFARSAPAAAALVEQFGSRRARREYLAICEGIPAPPEARLESLLVENPRSLKVAVTADRSRGKPAVCAYRVEERLREAALLRVRLETGRRNQIRVQLAASRHPLLGDRAYGHESPLIGRVALHAARLGFTHPRTGRPVSLECPLPPDMKRALRRLRESAGAGRGARPPA